MSICTYMLPLDYNIPKYRLSLLPDSLTTLLYTWPPDYPATRLPWLPHYPNYLTNPLHDYPTTN